MSAWKLLITFVTLANVGNVDAAVYTFNLTAEMNGRISSPNYPINYPTNSEYIYYVTASENWHRGRVDVDVAGIGNATDSASLTIYTDTGMSDTYMAPYCCGAMQTTLLVTGGFVVKFVTEETVSGPGFEIYYTFYTTIDINYQTDANQGIVLFVGLMGHKTKGRGWVYN